MHSTGSWIESTIGSPADQPSAWETVPYLLGGHEILLARPRDPDRLLDDPAVQRASKTNDYMPYWAYLWPGAMLLAEHVLAAKWPVGAAAIEIGCGLGLTGVAALWAGLNVTFSDYSPAALAMAAHNARLNGFDQFETRLVDWQRPPGACYELVLGADVLYERRCLADVLRVLDSVLAPTGVAVLADPNRAVADPFAELARARGYRAASEQVTSATEAGSAVEGRIFRLVRGENSVG